MIYGPTKSELIRRKYLAPSLVKRPPAEDLIIGRGSDGRGDYSTSRTLDRQAPGVLIEKAIDWLLFWENAYQRRLKTLIYCLNINHALAVAAYARSVGIPTETLFAKTPRTERVAAVERYKTGQTNAIANVGILTEGFDAPDTDCVLCLRPTQSLSLWVQMAGRANRLSEGKTTGLILDGTTNTQRLGHPDTDFPWTLKARSERERDGAGESPMRRCPAQDCQTLNASGTKRCVECGEPFGLECPLCGWVFGTQTEDGVLEMPDLDRLGRCERCSLTAQEKRFGRPIPKLAEFAAQFRSNKNDNLTYTDQNIKHALLDNPVRQQQDRTPLLPRRSVYLDDQRSRRVAARQRGGQTDPKQRQGGALLRWKHRLCTQNAGRRHSVSIPAGISTSNDEHDVGPTNAPARRFAQP